MHGQAWEPAGQLSGARIFFRPLEFSIDSLPVSSLHTDMERN